MRKIIRLSDTIVTPDRLDVKPSDNRGFDTRCIITARNCRHDGSVDVQVKHNRTALSGRTKLLEDNFGIIPNMEQHIFINDNVLGEYDPITGASAATTTMHNSPANLMPRNNPTLWRRRKTEYWAAGDGAVNKTMVDKSWAPHATDTMLYHMIPFRFIKADQSLPADIRKLYKGEVIYPANSPFYGYKGYLFKAFDLSSTDGIQMTVDGNLYRPKWADTVPNLNAESSSGYENAFKGDKTQMSYIDISMHISTEEFKEYFEAVYGSLQDAKLSELAFITGLTAYNNTNALIPLEDLDKTSASYANAYSAAEVYDAEVFAHLTFDPYSVGRENSTIDFEYRIFV